MSKKRKRQVSHQSSSQLSRQATNTPTRSTEFNPDYTTTKRELRRIGILAASFVFALVVLAIFQNQLMSLFIK